MTLLDFRRRPALFHSVRSSSDRALVAVLGALLVAVGLHAGAMLPRVGPTSDSSSGEAPRAAATTGQAETVVARRAAASPRRAPGAERSPADDPCAPRG